MSSIAKPIPVVCAIIHQGERFLACRRDRAKLQGGLWEFPGGKVHAGESSQEALKRELLEELAIDVAVGDLVAKSAYTYDHGAIELSAFECRVVNGALQPREHEAVLWVTAGEAEALAWAPADVPIVKAWVQSRFHA